MAKHILSRVLGAVIFGLLVLGVYFLGPSQQVNAATCYKSGCNNTNPHSTGCDASAGNVAVMYPASSKVELRRSLLSACETLWTRTKNTDALNRSFYAYATLRFYSTPYTWYNSPSPIPKNAVIYTNQWHDPLVADWHACGYVGSSYISYPVGSPCAP
jgi:hypothetical protein